MRRFGRRSGWYVIPLILGVACCAAPFFVHGEAVREDQPTRATRLEWGVYQIYWGGRVESRFRDAIAGLSGSLGARPDYVMFYRDLSRPFPESSIEVIRSLGATPIISLELWHWHDPKRVRLGQIAEGKYDAYFEEWAGAAAKDGRRVLLRFGFEFNGDWFSWGGQPEVFVRAWRRAHDLFGKQGAKNVEWVWAANVTSHPKGAANSMHRYWPGDGYVDWVAVDGYNWGDHFDQWHVWQSFDDVFEDVLKDLVARYPKKPIMIAEFGCPEDKDHPKRKSRWIRDAYRAANRYKRLKAVVWFNLDKRGEGELDFRINSSPQSFDAFKETFAAGGR